MPPDLHQLVTDVAEATGDPLPAMLDADAPVLDGAGLPARGAGGFYLVGLIGGKEVGKSALANAVAGRAIAESTASGPGTDAVLAYAHESQAAAVRQLLDREAPGKFRIVTHAFDDLRRQVLLDLPDVDSHFADHVELTRRVLRHMLFPVWVQSVEKYADRRPLDLLAAVAAGNDPANFLFCLNKADHVADAEGDAAADELRHDFAARLARTLNLAHPPRVWLTSAARPGAFDLPALRATLAQQKTDASVGTAVVLASRQRGRSLMAWVDERHLPRRAERLRRLAAEADDAAATRLTVPIVEEGVARLLDDPGYRLALADEVMARRAARWPGVNVIHATLSPLLAVWRHNRGAAVRPGADELVDAYLNPPGRAVSAMVQATFAQLHGSHPAVGALYRHRRLWDAMPAEAAAAELRSRLAATLERQRVAAADTLAGRGGILAPLLRVGLTVGAVLWFPIVQPVLQIVLDRGAANRLWDVARIAVEVLSATYLLKSAGLLAIWFVSLWATIRWGTQRRVNRLLARWRQSDPREADPLSLAGQTIEWADGLLDPIRAERRQIDALAARAEAIRSSFAA